MLPINSFDERAVEPAAKRMIDRVNLIFGCGIWKRAQLVGQT